LRLNDFAALVMAAVQGQGLVCVPLQMVMPLFRAGQLRPLLVDCIDPKFEVYLYYPDRKNLPARTRSFVDFVLGRLSNEADLQTPHDVLVAPFIKR
jgi:DNA-binding transcriptional LysR family regulator